MSLLSMYQPQKKWNILSWWTLAISLEAKADFFCDMRRLAGEKILCGSVSDVVVIGNSTASGGDEVVSGAASN
jgi:hypothetical protein